VEPEHSGPKRQVNGERESEKRVEWRAEWQSLSENGVVSGDHRNRLKCRAAKQPTLLCSRAVVYNDTTISYYDKILMGT